LDLSYARASRTTVLQIIPRLNMGGAERTTIDIARALTQAGWRALVACDGGRMRSQLYDAGGELIRLPVASKNPLTMLSNTNQLVRIIREQQVSLVHARSRAPAWSALRAARRCGVPFVTTYHGIYNANTRLKRYYNSVMARGDVVIANSQWTADHIRVTYPHLAGRIVIIPRGLDLSAFDPASVTPERVATLRHQWGLDQDERVVLMPGRFARWKGHLVLVRALGRLARAGKLPPDLRVVMAGDARGHSDYVAKIREAVWTMSLPDVVILSGHVDDMPAAYLAATVVVSASTDPEAFGRVPPEAEAMGRPVIATDHGGARETMLPGESGLLLPPGDAKALADALEQLLTAPPEKLAEMGAKGQAHIKTRYSVERMCADTLAVYRDLIGQPPKP
jgi:glycosyltransferase involved in cell wall biosynthesis